MEETSDQNKTSVKETSGGSGTFKKGNSLVLIAIPILALLAVGIFLAKKPASTPTTETNTSKDVSTPANITPSGPRKEFNVNGSNFKFDPQTIKVNKGDVVTINFKDNDGMHDLVVDGYNVMTATVKAGEQDSLTFTASKTGTFEYYCSVDSHRQKGMTGTLIVE